VFKKAILKGFVSWVAASTLKEKLVFLEKEEFHVNPQIILVAKNSKDTQRELQIKITLIELKEQFSQKF